MSHHLDTPLAAQTGQLYLDDLYVFPGQDSTVLIMDVNSNVNGLHSEPGFHPEARYEFKVHVDGADFEALTYRVSFTEPGRLRAGRGPGPVPRRAALRGRRARGLRVYPRAKGTRNDPEENVMPDVIVGQENSTPHEHVLQRL